MPDLTASPLPPAPAQLKHLLLWRHAEAHPAAPGETDLQRCLTPKGEKQAARMGHWLGSALPARSHVMVSPAQRTLQTVAGLDWPYQVNPALAPEASPEALWQAVCESGAESVVLVGHQPTLGALAARLLCGEEQFWAVKKGALWWLNFRPPEALNPQRSLVRLRAVMPAELLPEV